MAHGSAVSTDKIYSIVPKAALVANLNLRTKSSFSGGPKKFLESFLEKNTPKPRTATGGQLQELQHRTLPLEGGGISKRVKSKFDKSRRRRKTLTASEKHDLKLFQLKPEEQRYSMYVPLHELWKDYMRDLVNFERLPVHPRSVPEAEMKLMKADYHGAIITVSQSKCPSLVGQTGIMLQETKHAFKIVTKEDRLKTLPKENSVFTVCVEDYVITLYGNNFKHKSSERASRKFKQKMSVDL